MLQKQGGIIDQCIDPLQPLQDDLLPSQPERHDAASNLPDPLPDIYKRDWL